MSGLGSASGSLSALAFHGRTRAQTDLSGWRHLKVLNTAKALISYRRFDLRGRRLSRESRSGAQGRWRADLEPTQHKKCRCRGKGRIGLAVGRVPGSMAEGRRSRCQSSSMSRVPRFRV